MEKIKVLIVDDSALIRNVLTRIINSQIDMTAVGAAPDALVARDMIKSLNPDVITLDIEMPKMDGLEFLEKLMKVRPMPVVMVSTMTERGADVTLRSLELGAVDFVTKPKLDITQGMLDYASDISEKIRTAYAARHRISKGLHASIAKTRTDTPVLTMGHRPSGPEKLILIGSSTGGTEAIRNILQQMPTDCPGILITQHMPVGFTKSFADRLNQVCRISVKEAEAGDVVMPGHAYIAPGDKHLQLGKSGGSYTCILNDSPAVNRHKPSVEVLFKSGTQLAAKHVVGVMLTGMGKDGAAAMLEMREAGAYNICQDEASCVVFGMPREAIALGAAHEVVTLMDIPKHIIDHLARTPTRGAARAT
jgi:two-component system chemotaxis response regulator CheB